MNFTQVECVVGDGGCSGLNENGHNRLTDVNAWPQGSGTIGKD